MSIIDTRALGEIGGTFGEDSLEAAFANSVNLIAASGPRVEGKAAVRIFVDPSRLVQPRTDQEVVARILWTATESA